MTTATNPRVSLTPRAAEIARTARALLESEGASALSMRNIAARLGIRAASLYEHFDDKRGVENAIMAAGMWEQGDLMAERLEGESTDRTIETIAEAFRDFAIAHPELYKLTMSRDLDRNAPDVAAAEQWAGSSIRAVVGEHRMMSLAIWSFAHGMADLELNHRLPPGFDADGVWAAGIGALNAELEARQAASSAASSPWRKEP